MECQLCYIKRNVKMYFLSECRVRSECHQILTASVLLEENLKTRLATMKFEVLHKLLTYYSTYYSMF